MAYAYINAQGKEYYGNDIEAPLPSTHNYVSYDKPGLFSTSVPFSLVLISLDDSREEPYELTLISPGYYMYVRLTAEEYQRDVLERGQHIHNTYEIVYTREGEFYQQIEARRYKYTARSCCLLNRNIRHKEEYAGRFSIVTLSLSPEFLQDLFSDPYDRAFSPGLSNWQDNEELRLFFDTELAETDQKRKSYLNFSPTYTQTAENDKIHDLFDQIARHLTAPVPGSSFILRALICQMLDQLSDRDRYSTKLVNLGTKAEGRLFTRITQLMEQSNGRISRTELTEQLSYSGVYLNQIVNKYTGMSIFQYGTYFAMQRAAWLLTHTDKTATEIAAELNFTDRTHFYKLFREEFGVTPRQYRIDHK